MGGRECAIVGGAVRRVLLMAICRLPSGHCAAISQYRAWGGGGSSRMALNDASPHSALSGSLGGRPVPP